MKIDAIVRTSIKPLLFIDSEGNSKNLLQYVFPNLKTVFYGHTTMQDFIKNRDTALLIEKIKVNLNPEIFNVVHDSQKPLFLSTLYENPNFSAQIFEAFNVFRLDDFKNIGDSDLLLKDFNFYKTSYLKRGFLSRDDSQLEKLIQ